MYYLSEQDLTALHDGAVRLYGGLAGIRDNDALASCLAQPQTAVFGVERFPTLAAKAAAYCFFVSRLHPFNDGNKRTAFLAGLHFLESNGVRSEFDQEKTLAMILAVVGGTADIDQLITFYENAVRP